MQTKKMRKKIGMLFLVLMTGILLLVFPTLQVYAATSGNYTPVEGVNVGVAGATNTSMTDGVITTTAKGSAGIFGIGASAKTATITVTNSGDTKAIIQFSWEKTTVNQLVIDGVSSNWDSPFRKTMNAGDSITITITTAKNATENKLVLKDFSYTPVIDAADITVQYDSTMGSVTSGGNAVASGDVISMTGDGATFTASKNNFVAWIDTSDNSILSRDPEFAYVPSKVTATIKAVYSTAPHFMVGSELFDNLNSAITTADQSAKIKTIVLISSGTLPSGTYTIPDGVTFLIPYDSANTLCTTRPTIISGGTKPSFYQTLTLSEGSNIVVDGVMSISGSHSQQQYYNGRPVGPLGCVKMNEGSNITVNSGGCLYVWGYITGSGSVFAKNGSTVYEDFIIRDWRGGKASLGMLKNSQKVFPVSQYYVQNVEVPMTIEAGATINAVTSMDLTSLYGVVTTEIAFIGSNGMFNLKNGTIIKDYIEEENRLRIDINGDLAMSALNIPATTGISINSGDYVLPISNHLLVSVNSGTTTISQDMVFLPGSEFVIAKDAIVNVSSGVNIYVYDLDQWAGEYYVFDDSEEKNGSGDTLNVVNRKGDTNPLHYVASNHEGNLAAPIVRQLTDATIIVEGTFDISAGYLYTSKTEASISADQNCTKYRRTLDSSNKVVYVACDGIYANDEDGNLTCSVCGYQSTGGRYANISGLNGGKILLQACGDATTYQYKNNDTYTAVTVSTAKLRNADGSYLTAGTTGTYTYNADHGRWVLGDHTETQTDSQAPSCTVDGWKTVTCACGYSNTETLTAPGHTSGTATEKNYNAASCTAPGSYDSVVNCTACGTELSKQNITVDALGHNYTATVKFNDDGTKYTVTIYCNRCKDTKTSGDLESDPSYTEGDCRTNSYTIYTASGEFETCAYSDTKKVVGTFGNHKPSKIEAKAPTCTETGNNEYWTCEVCGEFFADQACTQSTTQNAQTLPVQHALEQVGAQAATCTEVGWDAYKYCTKCDYTTYTEIPALKHNYVGTVTTPPTCTEKGEKTYVCQNDNSHTYTEEVDKKAHSLTQVDAEAATCTQFGWDAYEYCSECDYTTYEEISALGHDMQMTSEKVEAQCEVPGKEAVYTCANGCGHTTGGGAISALEHAWSTTLTKGETTHWYVCNNGCGEKGSEAAHAYTSYGYDETQHWKKCACGAVQDGTTADHGNWNADGECACGYGCTEHIPGDPATCMTPQTCTKCGHVITEALDHEYEAFAAQDAVHTATELKPSVAAHYYCKVCENYFTFTPEKVPTTLQALTGPTPTHTEVPMEHTGPTCTAEGYVGGTWCSDCRVPIKEAVLQPALGHDMKHIEAVESTCTTQGNNEYWYCERCDTYYKDEQGQTETTVEDETLDIDANAHDRVEHEGKAATCTEGGWEAYATCTRCNYTTYKAIGALGHDAISHDGKAATCTESGWETYQTCSRCDYTTYTVIGALGHDEVAHSAKEATCTAIGWDAYVTCSRCDYSTYKENDKLEHNPAAPVEANRVEASCSAEGYYDLVVYCTECETELSSTRNEIKKLDHEPGETVYENIQDATCFKMGSRDEVTYCTVCKAETSRVEKAIPKLEHTKGPMQVENKRDSTCYAEGSYEEVHYCTVTGCVDAEGGQTEISRETKTIEKKKHTPGGAIRENPVAPTCGADGSYESVVYCSVEECGAELSRESVVDPATGNHSYVVTDSKNATCTEDGYKVETCDVCGDEKTTTLTAPGHDYDDGVPTPPTCHDNGYITYTCGCGDVVTITDPNQPAINHRDENNDNICDIDTCKETICEHTWTVEVEWSEDFLTCTVIGTSSCGKHDKRAEASEKNFTVTKETVTPVTCYENGLAVHTAKFYDSWLLSDDGDEYVEIEVEVEIPTTNHAGTLTHVEAVSPTCTTDGNIEYWYCTACQKSFSDENGNTEVTEIVVSSPGHNYKVVVTDPTCSTQGYTTHTCQREECGHSYVDAYVDATGEHVYSEQRYYDRRESWKQCTGCDEKYDVVARTYDVTIVDRWGNETVRKGYTYGQYLWLNYSTSNVLDLEYVGWSFTENGEAIPAYEVWTKAPIDETTTEFTVYEVSKVNSVKYGAIMMSVSYDQANSEKTMTVDLFLYVDALDDAHKPTVTFGGEEKTLEKIDDSLMMWFVSIDLSAAQITQGGDNVKITVSYNGVPVKTIDSVLIAYEQALENYLEENVGDYDGEAQEEAITAMLNYGKTVQVYFENEDPSDWDFQNYTDQVIKSFASSNIPDRKSEQYGNIEEYSLRYEFEMTGLPTGVTPKSAKIIVTDKNGDSLGEYTDSGIDVRGDKENRYYAMYPVPASDIAKADTIVKMVITLSDGTTVIETPEFKYGMHAYLTYSIYHFTEEINPETGKVYTVSGETNTETRVKTKQYVQMLVSLLKLGEAVNQIEEMTSNQQ